MKWTQIMFFVQIFLFWSKRLRALVLSVEFIANDDFFFGYIIIVYDSETIANRSTYEMRMWTNVNSEHWSTLIKATNQRKKIEEKKTEKIPSEISSTSTEQWYYHISTSHISCMCRLYSQIKWFLNFHKTYQVLRNVVQSLILSVENWL